MIKELVKEMELSAIEYKKGNDEKASEHEARIDNIIDELTKGQVDPCEVKDDIRNPLWWDDESSVETREAIIKKVINKFLEA